MSVGAQDRSARQALNLLLERRLSRRNRARRLASAAVSILAHLVLTAAIALAPALAARKPQQIEFVQVQIVPLQALGVPEPVRPAPASQPEPALPEPSPSEETARTPPEQAIDEEDDRPPEPVTAPPPDRTIPENREPGNGDTGGAAQRRGSPTGSALATSPFGTSVAGFDNPDFQYGYYVDQMLALIGSNWVRPPSSGNVEMMIHFRIQDDGSLTGIEVVASSGDDSFDLAGLRAVRLASPLPPLPRSFPHSSLGVNLIIR